jgi:GTP-binding protein
MYVPTGGPVGGVGGSGVIVFLRGNRNYWTLVHLMYD